MKSIPELLAPAGSRASLEAAIEGGADAVYFGAGEFNARMRAENFSDDENIKNAVSLCRAYGVKSYITLNTRLFDNELMPALRLAAKLYEFGADALIVADMGLSSLIKKNIPDFELHASTQLSGHSIADAKALHDFGFARMVCQREICLEELNLLCKKSPIEIEMFVHGAHCVSFSGQCLMSAVMGGRSGNRGECAQPCRKEYTKDGKKCYPLSLRDMCLAGHIPEIISSGVKSLKIEGRQKNAEYVFGVVSLYRRFLDEGRSAYEDELSELENLFSRSGFTDGYLKNDKKNMLGIRTLDQYKNSEIEPFSGLKKKIPLEITLDKNKDGAPCLIASSFQKTVTVVENITGESASLSPLLKNGAEKSVSRLGNTPFYLEKFNFNDGAESLTLSALNKMRREAVEKLTSCSRKKIEILEAELKNTNNHFAPVYSAEFLSEKQITESAKKYFDRIYLPYGVENSSYGISLPPYLSDKTFEKVFDTIKKSFKENPKRDRHILCHSAAELAKAEEIGGVGALSLRGNIFNSHSAEYFEKFHPEFITFSPEVRLEKIRDAKCRTRKSAVVYGKLPLMLTARCAISDGKVLCGRKKCKNDLCFSDISDRYRIPFPVVGFFDCTNVIYNSVPTYMADRLDDIIKNDISCLHFIFCDESPKDVDKIISAYKNNVAPTRKNIKRML